MSPRNDALLSLCLTQAEMSPLHYRHGSVIVRGGKIIGQGFNSYRPGFDGGALKTGVLRASSHDGPAINGLKERSKSKHKSKSKPEKDDVYGPDKTAFTPFESTGHGYMPNKPLSMHSEMMAIQSALSLSSGASSSQASARSAKWLQKPCFSIPGDSKTRKARAQGLRAYAKAVYEDAGSASTSKVYRGKFSLQMQGFEPGASQSGAQGEQHETQQQGRGQRRSQGGKASYGLETREMCRETPQVEERVLGSTWTSLQRSLST